MRVVRVEALLFITDLYILKFGNIILISLHGIKPNTRAIIGRKMKKTSKQGRVISRVNLHFPLKERFTVISPPTQSPPRSLLATT